MSSIIRRNISWKRIWGKRRKVLALCMFPGCRRCKIITAAERPGESCKTEYGSVNGRLQLHFRSEQASVLYSGESRKWEGHSQTVSMGRKGHQRQCMEILCST